MELGRQIFIQKKIVGKDSVRRLTKFQFEATKFILEIIADFLLNINTKKTTTNALLLFCDPIQERTYGKDSAEVGHYSTSIDTFYDNKERYQLSMSVQPDNYFKDKTKQELKIKRNTIYANYGLIFQAGGEMEKYFRQKNWYNPFQKDVSNCLTDIERKNIQTIARLEQR